MRPTEFRLSIRLSLLACVLPAAILPVQGVAQTVVGAAVGSRSPIDTWPVRDNVYMLAGAGGNITASIGPDGILLVDSGLRNSGAAVLAALAELEQRIPSRDASARPISYLINTGLYSKDAAGAISLGASQTNAMPVIAHENVLVRLVNQSAPFAVLPTATISNGEYNFGSPFNGESIRLIHVPAASTDGDTIVYFRSADVISSGTVFSMDAFPVLDVTNGGSIDGIIGALNTILNIAIPGAFSDGGTLIVPSSGRLADSADVGAYRDMLTIIRNQVRYLIDAGMTLDQIQAARPTLGYDRRFGSQGGTGDSTAFVEAVYRSLTETPR